MTRQKKIVLMIAGILTVILIAAIVVIVSIDINSHKQQIGNAVSEAIGLQVRIGGPMGLSYFPLGVAAGDVHITNQSEEILSIERLKIGLELMPLLKGQTKIIRCDMLRPAFTIAMDAGGKYNFESEKKSAPRPARALSMNEIKLSKGSLFYTDRKTGERTEFKDVNFNLKDVVIEDISGDLINGLSFAGSLNFKEVLQKEFRIDDLEAVISVESGKFSLKPLTIGSIISTDGKTGNKTELHNINLDLKGLSMADILGDIIRDASFEGNMECKEVLQKGLRIANIKAAVKEYKGIYNFKPLTIEKLVVSDRKSGEKTEVKDIKLDANELSIIDGSGDMIRNLAFAGRVECKEVRKGEISIDNVSGPVKADRGVYHLNPFAADILGGKGEGDVTANLSGIADLYKINLKVSGLDFEKLTEAFGKKKVIGGKGNIVASISIKEKPGRDFINSLGGEFTLRGDNLVLYAMDLDKVLSRFEETQNFNLIDLGAFFIAGPLGTAATKGVGYGSLYAGAGGDGALSGNLSQTGR
jgi:uncharacterized protein involved in outer membrane biogenesis